MPIDLGPNSLLGLAAPSLKKPPFLVVLEDFNGKARSTQKFICLDQPEFMQGMIKVKGFFSEKNEEEIIKSFTDILTKTSKDLILEMFFPIHRIFYIRNLVFNAVKVPTNVIPGKE